MTTVLETRDLKKHYQMGGSTVRALDGVSITVEQGEFVGLLGTSGSGKSTLLNLVAGLDRPSEGSLRIFDQDLAGMSSMELSLHRRNNVGIIFQSFNLVSTMSAAENVALAMMFAGVAREEREGRASQLLGSMGLGERQKHRPRELSGGEQQRVAIARALSNNPHLLLADEPTGNLDSRTSGEIMALLKGLNEREGKTIIMVTHDPSLARTYAHRTITMLDGAVIGEEGAVRIVTFRDTAGLALRNLGQAKLRTSLTVMGVSIGIASLAGMVSLGVGLEDQLVGRFTKSGVFDTVTVLPGSVGQITFGPGGRGRGGGRRGFGRNNTAAAVPENARELTDDALAELAALPEVKDVYPTLRVPVDVKYGNDSEFAAAAGVPMGANGVGAFQAISYGRFFASDTEAACMLSLDYAKRINDTDPKSLLGKELTLGYATSVDGVMQRTELKSAIVGIVERESGPFSGAAGVSPLMIPMGKAKEIFARSLATAQALLRDPTRTLRPYQSAVVKVKSAQRTQDVEDQIKKMGFSAFSVIDALQGAKRGFLILDIVLSLIGSIALAVSSLGIMNTMVMSILERTREIGIMKAIGGSDGDIRRIFLIEASAIGLFGGITGVILGWVVGRIINIGANLYIQQQGGTPGNLFSLPFWLIGGAIGFSIAISLLAGSYPAGRAAKLDPIQALRHD